MGPKPSALVHAKHMAPKLRAGSYVCIVLCSTTLVPIVWLLLMLLHLVLLLLLLLMVLMSLLILVSLH